MLGLTLEGGASRTVYSCGIMDALLEDKIIADYVIGVSAGAAFGVSYCSGQIGRNLRLATEFMGTKKYMGARHLIDPKTDATITLIMPTTLCLMLSFPLIMKPTETSRADFVQLLQT